MKKKLNPILKSVIVLSCIAVVCVAILAVANNFWGISDEVRLGRALNKLIPNDGAVTVYDINDDALHAQEIKAFNSSATVSSSTVDARILKVYKIKDNTGVNDGKLVVESQGKGFGGGYTTVLTAFNTSGTVYGFSIKEWGKNDNLSNQLNIPSMSDQLSGKEAGSVTIADLTTSATATFTINGVLRAVNFGGLFYKSVILGQAPALTQAVTGAEKAKLDTLLDAAGQTSESYTRYNTVVTSEASYPTDNKYNGKASLTGVIITDNGWVIMEVSATGSSAEGSTYGSWSAYILMNSSDTIASIYTTGGGRALGYTGHSLEDFKNSILNEAFSNKTIAELFPMTGYINNTTGATESNNGVKACVYCALSKIGYARAQVEAVNQQISQQEG